jgi:hypothetical protein
MASSLPIFDQEFFKKAFLQSRAMPAALSAENAGSAK